jgi:enoyl-CoA hydratase/carnithine racemase
MLSTDIRAAAPEARFGLTEVKWSIYPFGGSTIKLIQQIGYVHAMDLRAARTLTVQQCVGAHAPRWVSIPEVLWGHTSS